MTTTSKMKTSPYTPINDMMTAEEAAEALGSTAANIRDAILRNDNCAFTRRVNAMKQYIELLCLYVQQVEPAQVPRPEWMVRNLEILTQSAQYDIPWQGLEPSEIQQICRTTGKR